MKNIFNILKCPPAILIFVLGVSVFALGAALTGQYVFGLKPCTLCLYQRIPFIAAIIIALCGLAFKSKSGVMRGAIGLSGLAFATNAAIAFYHTGVEQKWWVSAVEGCKVDFSSLGDGQSYLEKIMSTPGTPCDVIPWQDPLLGLSMANYNILLGIGMAVICFTHLIFDILKKRL